MYMKVFLRNLLLGAALFSASELLAVSNSERERAVINPIELNYRFSVLHNEAPRREAADPEIIYYKDKYYLFASKSGGYWSSPDLVKWTYIPTKSIAIIEHYAPTVEVINGELCYYATGSDSIFKTTAPDSGVWTRQHIDFPRRETDPDLFVDDDGRVYLFWGCSPKDPIMGVELDPKSNFKMIGEPVEIIWHGFKTNGWEKPGDNNQQDHAGWNEGGNLVKHKGKYYLQFAAPGTQWRSYCDGAYVADKPLGPYTYMKSSPFSTKFGGFIGSAGHGAVFKDKYGNYWHAASMLVGVNHGFERRLGLFPVFFDEKNSQMYSPTEMTDTPFVIPNKKVDFRKNNLSLGLNILSYKKEATATSSLEKYTPENAVDEQIETCWCAETGNAGEAITVDLGRICNVDALHINFADKGFNTYADKGDPAPIYRYKILASLDGKSWRTIADNSNPQSEISVPHKLFMLPKTEKARYLKLENSADLQNGKFSVSGFRVFGTSDVEKVSAIKNLKIVRDSSDPRNVEISWDADKNAEGYILSWGIEKDKLYNARTLRTNSVKGSFLTIGLPYYFSVQAFNGAGKGNVVKSERID